MYAASPALCVLMLLALPNEIVSLMVVKTGSFSTGVNVFYTCRKGATWVKQWLIERKRLRAKGLGFCVDISSFFGDHIGSKTQSGMHVTALDVAAPLSLYEIKSLDYAVALTRVHRVVSDSSDLVQIFIKYNPKTFTPYDAEEEIDDVLSPCFVDIDFIAGRCVVRIRGEDVSRRAAFRFKTILGARIKLEEVLLLHGF